VWGPPDGLPQYRCTGTDRTIGTICSLGAGHYNGIVFSMLDRGVGHVRMSYAFAWTIVRPPRHVAPRAKTFLLVETVWREGVGLGRFPPCIADHYIARVVRRVLGSVKQQTFLPSIRFNSTVMVLNMLAI